MFATTQSIFIVWKSGYRWVWHGSLSWVCIFCRSGPWPRIYTYIAAKVRSYASL